ncbi:hypothetical protein WR25_10647 [Diploscapter pachys]|uniref:Uncharacterized protein n=1 Tax=Diploscapter pachys TaxID=2018661 RepID=A0A2A2M1L3_9BILA|nr:hypothetical protein WR25_10647 [Diploscapter pachys]
MSRVSFTDEGEVSIDCNLEPHQQALIFTAGRVATFTRWPFDKIDSATCTSIAMALAGFKSTATAGCPESACCVFCGKEMLFEENDDPWKEHIEHTRFCPFVELDRKKESDWTVEDYLRLKAGLIATDILRQNREDLEKFRNGVDEIRQAIKEKIRD